MDPRQLRTRARLRETMYRIASAEPVDQLTMAAIAREAGVTRDTVYRHGPDPVRLLADLLDEELRAFTEEVRDLPAVAPSGGTVFDDSERELLEHIRQHAGIYRNALCPRLIGPLRDLLIDRISEALRDYLEAHPGVAPAVDPGIDEETHRSMVVAYAAAGTVAAIEEWLRAGDLDAPDAAARTVIAASPEWWLGRR